MGEAAPLFMPPDGSAAPVGTAEWFDGAGGVRLRAALFPAQNPRGSVILSGGRTEFIEKYLEVIGELVGRGFTVLTHDWRGQGLSQRLLADRLKGHAAGFDDFATDFRRLLDTFENRLPGPRLVLSHSMGGCLTLLALAKGERRPAGAVFSAPMLGLVAHRSTANRSAVAAMTRLGQAAGFAPGGPVDPFAGTFEADRLTHDRARYDRTRAMLAAHPELVLGSVTWGWVWSAFSALRWLQTAPEVTRLDLPVVIVGAGQEKLVDNIGQKLVAERIPGCRRIEIPEAYHEILMETDAVRSVFWSEFDELAFRLAPPV